MNDKKKLVLDIQNLNVAIKKISNEEILYPVENVSLQIHQGDFCALIGESGSGKTLTALSILNLLPENIFINSGHIYFKNIDLTTLTKSEYRKILGKEISIIFQDPMSCLNPLKKVGIQIAEAALSHGTCKKEAKTKTLKILQTVGFSNPEQIYNCYPNELSGGMMQRILISMALINEPSILIADEATTALDVTIQKEILDLLFELNKKLNLSVLFITHDLTIVSNICDYVYVMYCGQIVEHGRVNKVTNNNSDSIIKNPLHPYTKALISAIPNYQNKNKKLPIITGSTPTLLERKTINCNFFDRCNFCRQNKITEQCKNVPLELKEVSQHHFVRCFYYNGENKK